MIKSRILLSAVTAGMLCSVTLAEDKIGNTIIVNKDNQAEHQNGINAGWTSDGNSIKNSVIIKDGAKVDNKDKDIISGNSKDKKVNKNIVGIFGGSEVTAKYLIGGKVNIPTPTSGAMANDNNVTISGEGTKVKVNYEFMGAWVNGPGVANDNNVTIENGAEVTSPNIYGGTSNGQSANGNRVIIDSAKVTSNIFGGDTVDSGK